MKYACAVGHGVMKRESPALDTRSSKLVQIMSVALKYSSGENKLLVL
jgi:hypothetical protein